MDKIMKLSRSRSSKKSKQLDLDVSDHINDGIFINYVNYQVSVEKSTELLNYISLHDMCVSFEYSRQAVTLLHTVKVSFLFSSPVASPVFLHPDGRP